MLKLLPLYYDSRKDDLTFYKCVLSAFMIDTIKSLLEGLSPNYSTEALAFHKTVAWFAGSVIINFYNR
jgi:hypothetical protein